MVYKLIQALFEELNAHLKYNDDTTEDVLVLSNLVDVVGGKSFQSDNHVHFQLIRIEEDRTLNRTSGYKGLAYDSGPKLFHIYILFAANFSGKHYPTGLKYIDLILQFFVNNRVLNSSNINLFPDSLENLNVELVNLEERELSNLWGATGAKLLPHLYYKISYVPIQKGSSLSDSIGRIGEIGPNLNTK